MLDRLRRLVRSFQQAIDRVERESTRGQARELRSDGFPHTHVIGVVILCCLVVSFIEYFGGSHDWNWLADTAGLVREDWRGAVQHFFRDDKHARLHQLGYWTGCTVVGYLVVPALWTKFVMGRSLREMGFETTGFLRHSWIYVAIFLFILPFVYAASTTQSFQNQYPFYNNATRSYYDFIAWELLYAMQFLSLEYFFRGFLIHGLKRRFGFYAVFVSAIPYCMIHFGKPFPETIGSILAGITLGILSLFTGSIWLGVAIHISVAWTMDLLAVW